jgi:membrane-associated protease RseP (regulator of RpoE activity)
MTRRLLLPAGLLAIAATALASGADVLQPRPDTGVSVRVTPGAQGKGGKTVWARDAKGMEHALQMEARDGRVIVRGEPDPNRPWLGVLLSDAEEVERLGSGLPTKDGRWTVTSVAEASPAQRAGLQRGDVITGVEGRDILVGGPGMLDGRKPGDRVTYEIERDGVARRIQVQLGSHPGTVQFDDADGLGALDVAGNMLGGLQGLEALKSLKELKALPCPSGTKPEDCPGLVLGMPFIGGPRLGVSVEPMGDQLAKFFGAPAGHGLLVKDVLPGTPAERGGIEAGDIVLRVAGKEIHAAGDIRAALEGKGDGDSVDVDVLRRGVQKTIRVTLEDVEEHGALSFPHGSLFDAQQASELAAKALEDARRGLDDARRGLEAKQSGLDADTRRQVEKAVREAQSSLQRARESRREAEQSLPKADRSRTGSRLMSDADRAEDERRLAQGHAARAESERAMAELARERSVADAERQEMQRAVEQLHRESAAGAFDARARAELERALAGENLQVRPSESLIEF